MKRHILLSMPFFLISVLLPGQAQESKPEESKLDLTQPYLLLATTKSSTMQKELNEAAAGGYRVVVGGSTGGGEIVLVLGKDAQPAEVYEYKVLGTTKTSTMQKELDEVAAQGFRLLRHAMTGSGSEIVVVLEKAPGTPPLPFQYLVLATSLTGTLQKELGEAIGQGYEVAGMVSDASGVTLTKGGGEHMVILEKPAQSPGESPAQPAEQSKPDLGDRYLLLATEKTSTMQKELNKAAKEGHRILAGSPTSSTEIMMLLEKSAQPKTFQYKLLATNKASTLEKELNKTADKGFRLLRQTVAGKRGTGGSKFGFSFGGFRAPATAPDEIVAVMEAGPVSGQRYEYLVLDTMRTSTMQKEISEAVEEGYEVAAMAGSPSGGSKASINPVMSNLRVVLERERTE